MAKISSFPPIYDHAFQQASENLRRALPLINEHLTPVNPVNYAVWYEYVSGDNAALTHEIDSRLSKNEAITPQITQYLYEKYVLMGLPERLTETNNGLKLVVDNTIENINRAEVATNEYSSGLTSSQNLLENCNDVQQLKQLVSEILSNTQKLNSSSSELKQELVRTTEEIVKLREELELVKQSARTDGLTGLLNRSAFNHELQNLCEQSASFTLALLDLDYFKRLNDTFGHLLGDKVLQYFSTILSETCRANSHLAARFGGEEMALLLINIDQTQAFHMLENIRQRFANSSLKKKGSDESIGQVTVSIGVAEKNEEDTPQSLIERADKALYQSKENGRNQVTLS